MKEIWNPYEERTKQIDKVLKFLNEYKNFILILIISLVFFYTVNTMWKSYLYRTSQNIPCEEVRNILKGIKK